MSSPPIRFRPSAGGGAPFRRPFRPSNPNLASSSSGPYYYRPAPGFQNPRPPASHHAPLDRVEAAVAKAHRDLIASGEGVTVWKLSQSAALSLQADSWNSLGFSFHQVPLLRNLLAIEGKVNVFIHCFVKVRRMTSVHDLDVEICKSEGIEKFDELGLGPLLRHPLVHYYFSIPPDTKEVCEITFDELLSRLSVFLYRYKNREMKVEEFLDFLVEKHPTATKREDLGVRITSLGLYIKFIKGCRRAESNALNSIRESGSLKGEIGRPVDAVPEPSNDTLDDDDDENDHDNKIKGEEASTSLAPATVDDMKLLGVKIAKFDSSNDGKRLVGNGDLTEMNAMDFFKVIQTDQAKAGKLNLTNQDIKRFVTTWKEACMKKSIAEVLAVMVNVYIKSEKRKRKIQRLFSSYPAVGLLNVAVKSIKCGTLDNIIYNICEEESLGHHSNPPAGILDLDPSTAEEPVRNNNDALGEVGNSASVDNIIKNISIYFGLNHFVPRKGNVQEKQVAFRGCEIWLTTQFSVKEFESLGHGIFVEFLQKHASLLPSEVTCLLDGDFGESFPVEVSMLQKQLLLMVSQTAKNLAADSILDEQCISMLLKSQFPSISFQITSDEPEKVFANLTEAQKDDFSSPIIFSSTLLKKFSNRNASFNCNNTATLAYEVISKSGQLVNPYGSVSNKDAMECLLKAPILSDLQLWSHWDLLFAPSLGPLVEWLLNVGCAKELSCLVASDGRIIRIEQSATFDDFLEAAIEGSSFKAAAKLLSLVCEHGGLDNVPQPLLKCYAQRAIDIIVKTFLDHQETNTGWEVLGQRSSSAGNKIFGSAADNNGVNEIREDICRINLAYSAVSIFILDCLNKLPFEFHSFVADIFVSALRSCTKDAADIILSQCKQANERIMLHDIGLSLGIVEWIKDYHALSLATSQPDKPEIGKCLSHAPKVFQNLFPNYETMKVNADRNSRIVDWHCKSFEAMNETNSTSEEKTNKLELVGSGEFGDNRIQDANILIETIRREEFGLDSEQKTENTFLRRQHARLGRALHCLSQELYSQDSHCLLELVQNADDNSYPENVEPTLIFILQDIGIVVLNNERGFSDKNIRALCDVGTSTKKGSTGGYIGQKGIGFKSVFRVTDAPEIHSNGFHVKFDITEGQIGFILPTIIPPCDINSIKKQLSGALDQIDSNSWNTCIVLPFRSKYRCGTGLKSVMSMFSDLHPSLLLFLHRLQCIVFKSTMDDNICIMKREIIGDGIISVTHGKDKMNWLVVGQNLPASIIRPDVQMTRISLAFPLNQSDGEHYEPFLDQQPVFAFLPLRKYGLKFILQADFVLPSSREEIDGDSAWNQWLLSEFPNLFVAAGKSFSALACFQESPAKAVTTYMSFVPLAGEVQGFFAHLPHMIISKLRLSKCLLLDGPDVEWVPPCKVLRGWDEQSRNFLSDSLLKQHLGLGYLSREIVLPDSLAKALGIQEYGPKLLIDILSSVCHVNNNIRALGIKWVSLWLNAFYKSLSAHSSAFLNSFSPGTESNPIDIIREISFIPLSDGSYGSVAEGPIWLPLDASIFRFEGEEDLNHFSGLYSKLRVVSPLLFSLTTDDYQADEARVDNLVLILSKIGVQKLSAHGIIGKLILPSICMENLIDTDLSLMVEYLSFIMLHLQSACPSCHIERAEMITKLQKRPILLTNHGFKCPLEEPVHFSKEYGNFVDINRLISDTELNWIEVDAIYLKYPGAHPLSLRLSKWREFFLELGITDFVQVIHVEKNAPDIPCSGGRNVSSYTDHSVTGLLAEDWESPELTQILSTISTSDCLEKGKYLLEVLDKMWDDFFSSKVTIYNVHLSGELKKPCESSFIKSIRNSKWVACSLDYEVHYPKDIFCDCESVRSVLGAVALYSVPKVTSRQLLEDIGFKVQVTIDDALRAIQFLKDSGAPLASISQMSKLYTFIRDETTILEQKFNDMGTSIFIFIPNVRPARRKDVVPGTFMPPSEVYWHDPTGCVDWLMKKNLQHVSTSKVKYPTCITLASLYPALHEFFVSDCGVLEAPPFGKYLQILLQLSTIALPSEATHEVFQVFMRWADDFRSESLKTEEMLELKDSLLKEENTVLPTSQNKWVSLHPSFGLVCWCGDEEQVKQFKHLDGVCFIHFGELASSGKDMFYNKVTILMQNLGIPSLSEVLSREAIFYRIADNTEKASLIGWILPYAQRYLYNRHHDVYIHLKKNGFEKLSQLQVIVVEKLYYKNTLKGHDSTNNKRFESSCLLQGNTLYTTDSADAHSVFLELSRFFFSGITELHMANFLHIVTTMLEFGSTSEKIESFVVNSQNVPELPDGEPIWSLSSFTTSNEDEISIPFHLPPMVIKQHPNATRTQSIQRSWPPPNWKCASESHILSDNHVMEAPKVASAESIESISQNFLESIVDKEIDIKLVMDENSENAKDREQESTTSDIVVVEEITSSVEHSQSPEMLCWEIQEVDQTRETGRLGEVIACKYFTEKLGSTAVKWVNQVAETGLPYDLIIEEEANKTYIEVKSTRSINKDWFPISTNEWHCAAEKGDSFTIVWVVLASPSKAKILILKNPSRLCQQNVLQLAVVLPGNMKDNTA